MKKWSDTQDLILASSRRYVFAHKASGRLSQKSDREDDSLQNQMEAYHKRPLHILSRLDRPVSGIVTFSKESSFTKHFLKEQQASKVTKTYLAVVADRWEGETRQLTHYHWHDKKHMKARLTAEPVTGSTKVTLDCRLLGHLERYSVLELTLGSGRYHQIRAQLAATGHHIKGDVRYGARRGNKNRSIHLHAWRLEMKDLQGDPLRMEAALDMEDPLWAIVHKMTTEQNGE